MQMNPFVMQIRSIVLLRNFYCSQLETGFTTHISTYNVSNDSYSHWITFDFVPISNIQIPSNSVLGS